MRLSIFDRLLLFLSMIFMLVIGVCIAVVCTSATSFVKIARYIELSLDFQEGLLVLVLIAAVIILVAVKLILALFMSPKERTSNTDNTEKIVLKNSEDGNIMVSSDLVKDVAVRCAKASDDVRDVECRVLCEENGVKILMKYYLKRDIVISEFLSAAQAQLKDYIEKHSGVEVLSIDLCADVNGGSSSRIR